MMTIGHNTFLEISGIKKVIHTGETSLEKMSLPSGKNTEQQTVFIRQAAILRKNLHEWDRMLRDPRGEDWPTMLGRLNAAMVCILHRNIQVL